MTKKEREKYRLLDEIGFVGTQEGLSATAKKAIDKRISEFLNTYGEVPKKEKSSPDEERKMIKETTEFFRKLRAEAAKKKKAPKRHKD